MTLKNALAETVSNCKIYNFAGLFHHAAFGSFDKINQ